MTLERISGKCAKVFEDTGCFCFCLLLPVGQSCELKDCTSSCACTSPFTTDHIYFTLQLTVLQTMLLCFRYLNFFICFVLDIPHCYWFPFISVRYEPVSNLLKLAWVELSITVSASLHYF